MFSTDRGWSLGMTLGFDQFDRSFLQVSPMCRKPADPFVATPPEVLVALGLDDLDNSSADFETSLAAGSSKGCGSIGVFCEERHMCKGFLFPRAP